MLHAPFDHASLAAFGDGLTPMAESGQLMLLLRPMHRAHRSNAHTKRCKWRGRLHNSAKHEKEEALLPVFCSPQWFR